MSVRRWHLAGLSYGQNQIDAGGEYPAMEIAMMFLVKVIRPALAGPAADVRASIPLASRGCITVR